MPKLSDADLKKIEDILTQHDLVGHFTVPTLELREGNSARRDIVRIAQARPQIKALRSTFYHRPGWADEFGAELKKALIH